MTLNANSDLPGQPMPAHLEYLDDYPDDDTNGETRPSQALRDSLGSLGGTTDFIAEPFADNPPEQVAGSPPPPQRFREVRRRPRRTGWGWWLAAGALGLLAILVILPGILLLTLDAAGDLLDRLPRRVNHRFGLVQPDEIAPLFTAEVDHWAADIERWANEYDLDPNLLATVMQIESCGHASISSPAGANGLFQVMPFHFEAGEIYTDPDTNARRGAGYLNTCLGYADGDVALAMACYNGGHGVINRPYAEWASETQRYYTWSHQIYHDATSDLTSSPALEHWLQAGGSVLCDKAAAELGLR